MKYITKFQLLLITLVLKVSLASATQVTQLTFTYTIPAKLAGENAVPFYFPVPLKKTIAQESTYAVTGAQKWEESISDGSSLLRIWPMPGSAVRVTSVVRRKGVSIPVKSSLSNQTDYPPQVAFYLVSWPPFNHSIPDIQKVVSANHQTNLAERLNDYALWTWNHVQCKIVNGQWQYWPNLEEILSKGTGQCEEQASVLVALCRESHIPARLVYGVGPNKGDGRSKPISYVDGHTWVEVYLVGYGWIPLEQGIPDSLGKYPPLRIDYGYHPIPGYFMRSINAAGGMIPQDSNPETKYGDLTDYIVNSGDLQKMRQIMAAHRLMWDAVFSSSFPAISAVVDQQQFLTSNSGLNQQELQLKLENTAWVWPGAMEWFRLKPGGVVENKWNQGRGTWVVNSDLSLKLNFQGPGTTFRIQLTKDLQSYKAVGQDNTETINQDRLLP